MSAGRSCTSLAFRLADLDFPPIPLQGKAVRGAALAGWRRRLEPGLGWTAARVRMHSGHNGGIGADALVHRATAVRR